MGVKKVLFSIAAGAVVFSGFLLWENFRLRQQYEVVRYGWHLQRQEIDSLKREIDWERWADTVDAGTMARGRY